MTIKKRYFNSIVILLWIAVSARTYAQDTSVGDAKENELIAVLQSDAAKGEKAITCKRLAIYGTDRSVPSLAPLLGDKELSSWARIALEAIPGPAADAALREALNQLEGRLLIGVINSIAVRRDVDAVAVLARKIRDKDANVASAAAVALGHIGGTQAEKTLRQALADSPSGIRSAVAEGCILCAERFLQDDQAAQAVALYDTVWQADVSDQRHLEAIRGAILARGTAGIPLLIEQLRSADVKKLGIGLRAARELSGLEVTEALATELTNLPSEHQPLLLLALADRKDAAVLPTVLKAAESPTKDLRLTAIKILIRLGDVSCVPVLLKAATETDTQLEEAALETLIRLSGKEVDAEVVARLGKARGKLLRVLIEAAGQRQIAAALPVVVSSLTDADKGIRSAAVRTVSIIGQAPQTENLVQLLQDSKYADEREGLKKSLLAICGRHGLPCSPYLQPLIEGHDSKLHVTGLRALAIIGGSDALEAVQNAIRNAEASVRDEAVRILSTWPNNWPDDGAAGQALLTLARSAGKNTHQVLSLRGYLQFLRVTKTLKDDQKVAKVIDILPDIKRPEEKRLAIAALATASSPSALDLLTTLAKEKPVAEEAYSAMAALSDRDIQGISKERRRQILQTVIESSRNNGTKDRARKILRKIR